MHDLDYLACQYTELGRVGQPAYRVWKDRPVCVHSLENRTANVQAFEYLICHCAELATVNAQDMKYFNWIHVQNLAESDDQCSGIVGIGWPTCRT